MKKGYFILLLFVVTWLPVNSANAGLLPVVESLDLYFDGSITPQKINQTESFDYLTRIIFAVHWQSVFVDFDDFGTAPLTNGTCIMYEGINLTNGGIIDIHTFAHSSYDLTIYSDGKSPADHHLSSRLSFFKFIEGGLDMRDGQNITFIISDDITAVCDLFIVTLEGYIGPAVVVPDSNDFIWNPTTFLNFVASSFVQTAIAIILLVASIIIVYRVVKAVFNR